MRYRADIDGLRAVAILTVVAFHALPSAMPGGFIGVDIFFVISGYLISGIILGELALGHFTIQAFYGRRVRRIFPALVLVLAATLVIGRLVLFPDELRELGRHTLAGAAFVANLALWRDADYFTIEAVRRPLLHLWSLGIEEQFYIAWPLVLWLTRSNLRRAFWVIVIVIAASFAMNLVGIYGLGRQTLVFYMPFTRVWELACGSLLAVLAIEARTEVSPEAGAVARPPEANDPAPAPWRNGFACAGAALIVVGVAFIDRDAAFPGWKALLPTGGAMLLIAAGPTTWINRKILSHPFAVFVGLISFPLYLWHWPLLVFQAMLWPDSSWARGGAVALAVVLATSTYLYLERPVRSSRKTRGRITGLLVVANCLVAAAGAAVLTNALTRPVPDAAARVLAAADDWAFPETTALNRQGNINVLHIATDRPEDVTLYIGDSHTQQYWPRLVALSEQRRAGMNTIEFATYAGCAPLPGVNRVEHDFRCPQFFEQAVHLAESENVKVVVFGGWWEWYFVPRSPGAVYSLSGGSRRPIAIDSPEGTAVLTQFGDLIRRLVASRKRVYVLLSNPTAAELDPLSMVERISYRVTPREFIDRNTFESMARPVTDRVRTIAEAAGAQVVNPADVLCDATRCRATTADGLPLYKDSNHLRASYARQQEFLDPFNY